MSNEERVLTLRAVAELTLLFHSGSTWSTEKALQWQWAAMVVVEAAGAPWETRFDDVTTKCLCDLVRLAVQATRNAQQELATMLARD